MVSILLAAVQILLVPVSLIVGTKQTNVKSPAISYTALVPVFQIFFIHGVLPPLYTRCSTSIIITVFHLFYIHGVLPSLYIRCSAPPLEIFPHIKRTILQANRLSFKTTRPVISLPFHLLSTTNLSNLGCQRSEAFENHAIFHHCSGSGPRSKLLCRPGCQLCQVFEPAVRRQASSQ
jgi:hypothetical protein